MAFNFPSSPAVDQTYTSGSSTYKYNGSAWIVVGVAAAPFDAMAYSGMQINGGMEVSQALGDTPVAGYGYICDGWKVSSSAAIAGSAWRQTGVLVPGFPCHLVNGNGAIVSLLAANDYFTFHHPIEGYRISRLAWGTANAQPITICFWSAHSLTGIYSVCIENGTSTHSYCTTYTQAAANVAQYNVITIPGATVGTWDADNDLGIDVIFTCAMGSTYTAPSANTWLAGDYQAAPGQVNGASVSFSGRLTGVTVLPGSQAPTAAQSPNIMRPYDQELVTCQRYWCSGSNSWNSNIMAGQANIGDTIYFTTTMRAVPTITVVNLAATAINPAANIQQATTGAAEIYHQCWAAGEAACVESWTADARL
jgi:hypothetical protein